MSAAIIQFPRAKRIPTRATRASSAEVSVIPCLYPPHWSDHQQYIFDHMMRDGRSVEEATAHIEAQIHDMEDAKALPSERDQLLFLARRALSRMRKIGD
ncbi:hypothetical protein [Rhodanobacter sp. DHB23]|uniref:hypothetical protein n=1 Tax=Rhodanobacter sp. DHB23 TaxID=2775923 RepID=UPI0017803B3A|nr:hypothetical protein [Rhodanobacter sp. DHB23]MBD8873859.1 hypothetical protein [Rhodanobacter sp. DHB23]